VFQAGGLPVVATCGTALTSAQAQQLRRFAPKAVLCYDPDNAGQNAAERSSELLVGEGFDVNVVLLPGGRRSRHLHPEAGARRLRGAAEIVAALPGIPAGSGGGRPRPEP
jgi:DNA primase